MRERDLFISRNWLLQVFGASKSESCSAGRLEMHKSGCSLESEGWKLRQNFSVAV